MDERSNWTASLSLENLTLEQVDELIVKIVEFVEQMGGFVAGGFVPEEEEEGEHGEDG